MLERARVLGAAFRVAHLISAARPGVLPATHFRSQGRKLMLVFEHRMVDLVADRVGSRFKQLARLLGRSGSIVQPLEEVFPRARAAATCSSAAARSCAAPDIAQHKHQDDAERAAKEFAARAAIGKLRRDAECSQDESRRVPRVPRTVR